MNGIGRFSILQRLFWLQKLGPGEKLESGKLEIAFQIKIFRFISISYFN